MQSGARDNNIIITYLLLLYCTAAVIGLKRIENYIVSAVVLGWGVMVEENKFISNFECEQVKCHLLIYAVYSYIIRTYTILFIIYIL